MSGHCGWIIDGAVASDRHFEQALALASSVRRYRRTPRMFAGWLSRDVVDELTDATELRFFPDSQLTPFITAEQFRKFSTAKTAPAPGLNQVVQMVNAPSAWSRATGENVYIAVVDSGINGQHPEFPDWKKAGGWSHDGSDPWTDFSGHGTMCAVIAAGNPARRARLCGVAPNAKLYSCKTEYRISEIIAAYEWVEDQRDAHQRPVVISNSFGYKVKDPPQENGMLIERDHPLCHVIRRVVGSGIPMVFAAGNNHDPQQATQCTPSTIWAWNSMEEVLTVAEVDENHSVRPYSSRGPGQWASQHCPKPDCAAPTFGWILFDSTYKCAAEGWGTSGAAPQAAGLLSLLLERDPQAPAAVLYDRIRTSCRSLGAGRNCVGSGLIDCDAAL
ncbi:MAG: hypothetical protein DWQ37_04155 [Planctomycetota bacterium]|nr:MAG: hypothetical protein DWQ37_04155 [Planctomycetota bacterium]